MDRTFSNIGFNTSFQSAGKILSALLSLITVSILTRHLGLSGYGDFTLVFSYMTVFGIIGDFGLQLTIVRELSQAKSKTKEMIGTFFWIKLVLIIVATILAFIALIFFPYSTSFKYDIILGSVAYGIGSLNGFGSAIFQSKHKLPLITISDLIAKFITVILIAFFVFNRLNFSWIISAVLIGNLGASLYTAVELIRLGSVSFSYAHEFSKKLIIWSIPIGFTSLFTFAYFRVDIFMLSLMKGSSAVGIYGFSYKIFDNIIVFWAFYLASVYPVMAGLYVDKQIAKIKKILKTSLIFAIVSSACIITVSFIFAPQFVSLLGGEKFKQSITVFRILVFALPFVFIDNLFYNILLIRRKIIPVILVLTAGFIFNFATNFLLIPRFSYYGASVTTILSELIILGGYLIVVNFI